MADSNFVNNGRYHLFTRVYKLEKSQDKHVEPMAYCETEEHAGEGTMMKIWDKHFRQNQPLGSVNYSFKP